MPASRAMEPAGDPEGASVGGTFNDQSCPWCGHLLTTLFDIDLAHPYAGFLGIGGRRLRIPTCEFCVCYATLYMEVDLAGGAQWSDSNQRPEFLAASSDPRPDEDHIPAGIRTLGKPRSSPFL